MTPHSCSCWKNTAKTSTQSTVTTKSLGVGGVMVVRWCRWLGAGYGWPPGRMATWWGSVFRIRWSSIWLVYLWFSGKPTSRGCRAGRRAGVTWLWNWGGGVVFCVTPSGNATRWRFTGGVIQNPDSYWWGCIPKQCCVSQNRRLWCSWNRIPTSRAGPGPACCRSPQPHSTTLRGCLPRDPPLG